MLSKNCKNKLNVRFTRCTSRFALCISHFALCIAFLSACATTAPPPDGLKAEALVWPPSPLEPRIEWVKEIRDYKDAGVGQGFWKRVWDFIAGEEEARIVKPYGICFDESMRLFVVDTGGGAIHFMDMKNGRYRTIKGEGGKGFLVPIGVARDDEDALYVTDSGAGTVYRYNLTEQSLKPFTPFKLMRPTGIAFNPSNGFIYVTDTAAHQVVALDATGTEQFRFGSRGTEPGRFNFPTDITIEGRGRVIVTDALNNRIQIFSATGKLISAFGEAGDTEGRFAKPKGVAVDSDGHIYVCDAQLDMIQVFDETGQLLLTFGESGSEPGQFWMPSGIYIDRNDFIYVSDSYNQRVQVFKYLKSAK